jgi:pSer/pThr/pTyr-binding forkhead associated (FHA) protein
VRSDGTDHVLEATTTIGRGPDRAIRIDDPRVSRNHAVVRRDGERWTITDEGSSNGTRRNGTRITATTPVQLTDGDEIGIGPVTLTFRSGPGGSAA